MASSATVPRLCDWELEGLSKPVEFSSPETCFSEAKLEHKYEELVSSHLQTLALKDMKVRELILSLEAKRIQDAEEKVEAAKKEFLYEEPIRIRKSFEAGEEDAFNELEDETKVLFAFKMIESKEAIRKLELHSLTYKLWLRRIQFIRQKDKHERNDLQRFEQAIHNAQNVINQYRGFIYKRSQFDREEFQNRASILEKDLKGCLTKALVEKEKASFEMPEEDVMRFYSNRDLICAWLGLKVGFLDRLDKMKAENRDHLGLCDWIINFLQVFFEEVTPAEKSYPSKELLVSIGFDPMSAAVETIMARARNTQDHIDLCDMAEIYVRDEFKYVLSSVVVPRFPLESLLINTWFNLPKEIDDGKNYEYAVCYVNIMNLVTENPVASSTTCSKLKDILSKEHDKIVLFHGTDHESARDILFQGIDLGQGRQKRDFSCGSGFYLTDNSEEALNWARSTTAKPAMLAFQRTRQPAINCAFEMGTA
ncbi:hypothetical protein AWC38_SpisGene5943 [Stylophora pistillata]|uniref:DUF3990 domain-containing protein n=1 Tax=Stylophora pistillata TaxID=50429 RepID=A0A2B4SKA0_STYPI|nr:hypothetical protein AWC38_SpisGene5943 [Stylophora pistillata]